MHDRFPHARLELIGQNSVETVDRVRRGHLEAALVALPVEDDGLQVHPVVRDEVVYVSAHPDRVTVPVTPAHLAGATLVLSEATWGDGDYTRQRLRQVVQSAGGSLRAAIKVENVETALEIAATGIADAVTARSVLRRQQGNLAAPVFTASLEPRLHDHFAIVHRPGAALSRPIQTVVEIACARMREICAQ